LHDGERHKLNGVNQRAAELPQGLEDALALGDVATVARDDPDDGSAIRSMQKRGVRRDLVGGGYDIVTEVADDIDGGVARIDEKAAEHRMYRVGLEFERRDHSEVPAPAAESPEEILVLMGAGGEDFAVGGDYLAGQQIVDGHSVLAKQPTDATAQRETRDTRFRDYPARDGETKWVRFAVEIA